MRHERTGEEGIALMVVMVLMGIMLTAGLAIVSTVDTQTQASQAQRVRDSSFNLAESALNAQIFAMAPGFASATAAFGTCTPATGTARCPNNAALVSNGSADLSGATWQTRVLDNGPAGSEDYYSDTDQVASPQPGWDRNGDKKVWVRAQSIAQGRQRTLVALVRSESQEEDIPRAALITGRLDISNNGNKELLQSNGGLVAVRCDPLAAGYGTSTACDGQPLGPKHDQLIAAQITGTKPLTSYAAGASMTADARDRIKTTAMQNGTYFAGCPPTADQLAGAVVYIESGSCTYTSNTNWNSPQKPGFVVINSGSLSVGGTANFYGVIYAVNAGGLGSKVIETFGNVQIIGGVLIDGNALTILGSSGLNIVFDVNAFRAVASVGQAGVVQNTFREIRAR